MVLSEEDARTKCSNNSYFGLRTSLFSDQKCRLGKQGPFCIHVWRETTTVTYYVQKTGNVVA